MEPWNIKKSAGNFFMLSSDPSVIIGEDSRIKLVNCAFNRVFNSPGLNITGLPFYSFFPGEQKEIFDIQLKKVKYSKGSFFHETRYTGSDGAPRWIQWSVVPHGRKRQYYVAGRDITLLKQQEEQLRISYTAMESAANGIYLLNMEETIIWVNSSFLKISGFTRDEILGKTPENMSSGIDYGQLFQAMRNTLNAGLVWIGEIINRKPDGTLYTVEQTIAPIHNLQGELSHFVAIMQDISERKKAEQILQEHMELLQRDIDLAGKVQASLLPAVLPSLEGYDIAAVAIPARYVSGDLYDCFLQNDGTCFLAMADISGKGVPAAMHASSVKTLIRSSPEPNEDPALFLQQINRKLYNQLSNAEMFVTLCAARFDPVDGSLCYASAGHTQGIIIRRGDSSIELLPPTGIPLGIRKETTYSETRTRLFPGDCFILYSDGITEAHNAQWELFGLERLIGILNSPSHPDTAREQIQLIMDEVTDFRKETPLSDDISLIAFYAKYQPVRFSFPADLVNLESMNSIVRESCSAYGRDFSYAMELSASEIFTNIIIHGYKEKEGIITAELKLFPERVELDIFDTAPSFKWDEQSKLPTIPLREGGYGLNLVRQQCDEFTCTPDGTDGNHWHMVKWRKNENSDITG